MVCDVCEAIGAAISSGVQDFDGDLGTAEELRNRAFGCSACQETLEAVVTDFIENYQESRLRITFHRMSLSTFCFKFNYDDVYHRFTVRYMIKDGPMALGLALTSRFINLERVRHWLDFCDKNHGGSCHTLAPSKKIDPLEKLLLVDVDRGCLIYMPGTTIYCALSYVWGQLPGSIETRLNNIEFFKHEGSLTSGTVLISLPKTIGDAIRLLRLIGQRYLWVDRLSIIQDDQENKHLYISRMDSIFANSYLTIIAATGEDADYGLPGVGLGSRPRSCSQSLINFPQVSLVKSIPHRPSRFYQRGWTFQERQLSSRALIFRDETVYWNCQRSAWAEEMVNGPERGIGQLDTSMSKPYWTIPFTIWPDVRLWSSLTYEYNKSDLTFEEDAHAAFIGIENVLKRSFPAGFLHGLPEFFFDWSLLWSSARKLEKRTALSSQNGYGFPSWSWLGWKGNLSYHAQNVCGSYWKDLNDPLLERQHDLDYRMEPLVDWVQAGPSPGQQRRIRNDWHKWQALEAAGRETPSGWNMREDEKGSWYTTDSAPGVAFRQPLPTAEQLPPEPAQKSWPPYLLLRSSSAFFMVAPPSAEAYQTLLKIKETLVVVSDLNGREAGVLYLDRLSADDSILGQVVELVAISRGRVKPNENNLGWFPEHYRENIKKTGDVLDFYNVLLINRQDGYVVREGVGRIEKSIWEQQDLKDFSAELR